MNALNLIQGELLVSQPSFGCIARNDLPLIICVCTPPVPNLEFCTQISDFYCLSRFPLEIFEILLCSVGLYLGMGMIYFHRNQFRVVTREESGPQILVRRIIKGAPNLCWGRWMTAGPPKSPNPVIITFFNTVNLLSKKHSFEHGTPNLLLATGAMLPRYSLGCHISWQVQ